MKRQLLLLPLLLLVFGCAGNKFYATEYHKAYDQYGQQIKFAVDVKKQLMFSLGQAYAQGLISDQQKETALKAGKLADIALETARDTLVAYMEGKTSRAAVLQALISANQNIYTIMAIVDGAGIGQVGGTLVGGAI